MYKFFLLIFFFAAALAKAQSPPGIKGMEVKTIEGRKYVFNNTGQLYVVVFLSPGCPLSQKYTHTLNTLAEEFKGKAKFYGVFAEGDPVPAEYKKFKKKYGIRFRLLVDKEKKLVKALGATVTPECFVVSEEKLVYHGAIDDWAVSLGKTKAKPTADHARNALQSALSGKRPAIEYSKPIGCFIE